MRIIGTCMGIFLILLLYGSSVPICAQNSDATDQNVALSGAITVTNKGISSVPSFSLGAPAMIYDLYIQKGNLGFEPQFRWGLDGKPWVFLFWWRYRLMAGERFQLLASAHPAISFTNRTMATEEVSEDVFAARRYLALELVPDYSITDHVGVSSRILLSRGFQNWTFKYLQFYSAILNLSNIALSDQLSLSVNPQVYFLALDEDSGIYFTASIRLDDDNFPLSLSSVITQPIETKISGGNEFLWNVSLTYSYDL